MILPVVLYGSEIWPLTLREEHRRSVFENRVLRMIFGPKLKYRKDAENFIMTSFLICTLQ
jgi:hypothetical protein